MSEKNGRVGTERFVEFWQQARSLSDAAAKSHMSGTAASGRACFLRKNGVQLKRFRGYGGRLDFTALNKLAQASLKETK